jgi:hypothetical protein
MGNIYVTNPKIELNFQTDQRKKKVPQMKNVPAARIIL